MMKHVRRIMFVLVIGFFLISVRNTGSASISSASISMEFNPIDQNGNIGDMASIDLLVIGADSTQVGAVDFWLNYNTNVLLFNSFAWVVSTPDSYEDINTDDLDPNATGNIDQIGFSAGWTAPQVFNSSSFSLLTMNFDIVGAGTSELWLTDAYGIKTNEFLFSDDQSTNIVSIAKVGTGNITGGSTSVPEPGTALLLGLGLAGLASLKKRKN